MKILAIETSTPRTEIAFLDDATLRFAESFVAPRRETGPLFSLLERALAIGGNPDRVVIGTGPGSYNGIRAGIATAEALAMGLGRPVMGLSSLWGYELAAPDFAVVGDARSQQFYVAHFQNGKLVSGPKLLSEAEAVAQVGSLPVTGPAPLAAFPTLVPGFPSAVQLARVAAERDPAAYPAQPIYLKPAHITSCKPAKGS